MWEESWNGQEKLLQQQFMSNSMDFKNKTRYYSLQFKQFSLILQLAIVYCNGNAYSSYKWGKAFGI